MSVIFGKTVKHLNVLDRLFAGSIMDWRYLGALIAYLAVSCEVTQGCDLYCCEGDRAAFVAAGWQNCCSEEQCLETLKKPTDWMKLAVTRREYYRPQPCNIQCCRGKSKGQSLNCCSEPICAALNTMDSEIRDDLFAQDLIQSMHQLQGLEWPVTESWLSFQLVKSKADESTIQPILHDPVRPREDTTTEDPEETRIKQIIATQPGIGTVLLYFFLGFLALIVCALGIWCRIAWYGFWIRHFTNSAPEPDYSPDSQPSPENPLVTATVIPVNESTPHPTHTELLPLRNLPPSYEEVAK